GEMVNTQMRVRQLQQKQTAVWCRDLGLPTREEVSSLGERLQQVRRELRRQVGGETSAEVLALRREVSALRHELAQLGVKPAKAPAAAQPKTAVRRTVTPARRTTTTARKR
ncbi:MAG TPA: poly(R)-hydroxyalkanoic acid synthase subunit PhaE, partial [Rhodanobacter sp.]|nr:poly(R)-hydroxyalkanoic acid synthase subunit PhaE [Rhodanobacter sp.]